MDDILLESIGRSDEPHLVQATLIAATGSSAKKIGAKMLVAASGKLLGGVTIGGCVDAQVIEAGDALVAEGGRRLLGISLDDDEAWEIGLTCGGRVEVVVERITPGDARDPLVGSYAAVRSALDAGRGAVVATALDGPRAAMVIDETGVRTGTLGDEATDGLAASMAADVLRSASRVETLPTPAGDRRVFFDRFVPPVTLVIVGAGQIGISLTRFARDLEMRTIVVDGRDRYATRERFPAADEVRVGMPSEIVAGLTLDARHGVILVSHDYKYELPVLRHVLRSSAGYVGMLGSKTRGAAVRTLLRDEGFTDEELARLRTPIGLSIGAATPAEVALAILAEVIGLRAGKLA